MNISKLFADYRHQILSCAEAIDQHPVFDNLLDSLILNIQMARDSLLLKKHNHADQVRIQLITSMQLILQEYLQYKTCRDQFFNQLGQPTEKYLQMQLPREEIAALYLEEKRLHWQAIWSVICANWMSLMDS